MEKQIKQVNYKEFNKAFGEIRNKVIEMSKTLPCGNVELYDDSCKYGSNKIEIKINWACCGAQNAEDTKAFADVLNKAIELASTFKYNGYDKTYED